jgi:hypothetical protein
VAAENTEVPLVTQQQPAFLGACIENEGLSILSVRIRIRGWIDSIGSYWFYCNASNVFVTKMPCLSNGFVTCDSFLVERSADRNGGRAGADERACRWA